MIIVDKLCYTSKLRYVNAMEKFVFSTITLLLCIVSHSIFIAVFVMLVTGMLIVGKGGISLSHYFKLMTVPLVFLLLSTLAIMINISHTPLDAFAIPVGSYYITASCGGILKGIQLTCTALSSVSCLYFLSLNTPITDILGIFQRLHLPGILIELMLLIYRYIFVMLHMASAVTTAQHSRLGNRNIHTARKSFAAMISSVFILSIKRSNALYDAMEARCYNGTIHVLPEEHPAKYSEILMIAVFELLLTVLTVIVLIRR